LRGVFGLDVPNDDDGHVLRDPVRLVEALDDRRRERGDLELGHLERRGERRPFVERRADRDEGGGAGRGVRAPRVPARLGDRLVERTLVEHGLDDRVAQDVEGVTEIPGRHRHVVDRLAVAGLAPNRAPESAHFLLHFTRGPFGRRLEGEIGQHARGSALGARFVARSRVHPHLDGDERPGSVLPDDDLHLVGKRPDEVGSGGGLRNDRRGGR
jgi:hypothetical protein